MEVSGKKLAGGAAIILLVGVATGHYTVPLLEQTTKTQQLVEVKKDQVNTNTKNDKDSHTKTVITEVQFPDGKKEKKTEITQDVEKHNDSNTVTKSNDSTKLTEVDTKVVKRELGLNLSFMVGSDFSYGLAQAPIHMCYGGQINKEILGPITLGAWADSCRQGGLQVGLQF